MFEKRLAVAFLFLFQEISDLIKEIPEIGEMFNHYQIADVRPTPLALFTFLYRSYGDSLDFQSRCDKAARAENYLANFDQWATAEHSHEVTMRIYQFLTNLLFKTGPMLYSRAKSSCFLNTAFQNFILLPPVMMGKPISDSVSQGVLKSFAYLLELLTGTLNFKQDSRLIEKVDGLILKWTPVLVELSAGTLKAGYLKVLRNVSDESVEYILKKLSDLIATKGTPADVAVFAAQLIKIFITELDQKDPKKLHIVLSVCFVPLMDHAAAVDGPSRKMIMELFRIFDAMPEVHDLLVTTLKTISRTKLIHQELQFFGFLKLFFGTNPIMARKYLPFLREAVGDVESMMGENKPRIRASFESLQRSLV